MSSRNRLKGMRRRAAKLLTCMQEQQQKYQPSEDESAGPQQEAELGKLTVLMQNVHQCSEQTNPEGGLLLYQAVLY